MKNFLLASGLLFFYALTGCSTPTHPPSKTAQSTSDHEARSKNYMIASQGYWTTRAAQEIFKQGGNAVDAAAAASFAIAVERPQSTGIGGGGFMMIRLANPRKILAVDFRETAPTKSTEKMFLDPQGEVIKKRSTDGIFSSATPGMVAGVLEIHKKYGKLSRAQILAPAIRLAEGGFEVYPHLADAINDRKDVLAQFPASKALFLHPNGEPLKLGEKLIQKDLARTLREISKKGKSGFYSGWVAEALLNEHQRLNGNLTQDDLNKYQVKFRKPVAGNFNGYKIYSMPPPSSGGTHVIEILNILNNDHLKEDGPQSPNSIHLTASAMQMAFADRSKYLGDSDFVTVPVAELTSSTYAAHRRGEIDPRRARNFSEVAPGKIRTRESHESWDTTHFTVADREGNIISSTQTVNGWLGSGVVVPGAGFVLNNQMDDFSVKPGVPNSFGVIGGFENAIQPGKRPLSSMSPTLVEKDSNPVLALGSPAGSQIITCVTLTLLNYLEYKMPLFEAVTAQRYHHQWTPDEIRVEPPGFGAETQNSLENMGYKIKPAGIGCKIEAVAFESGVLHGVSDPRGEGLSLGESNAPLPPEYSPAEHKSVQD